MQVVLSLSPGGTERLVIEIVRRLGALDVESLVCCLEDEGAWAAEARELGAPVIALHRRAGFAPSVGVAIARLVREHRVDVLHCHHYSPFVYGQIAALLAGDTRVVFTEHGRLSDAPPSVKRRLVNPWLGRLPTAIYAVSDDLRRHMVAEGFSASRVQVIHNGIDPGQPVDADARRAARAMLGLAGDTVTIGTVARLDPVKDLPTMIGAFASVQRRLPDARLVVIGDGPERRALIDLAAGLGIADDVLFTGHRQDVRALLPALDIFANSSIHEGVSLTILEAMATGVPVVATAAGGTPEVVNGSTGVLVPCRHVEAFAEALLDLANDAARRRVLGAAARARVESAFSIERMVAQYVASYEGASARATAMPADARART